MPSTTIPPFVSWTFDKACPTMEWTTTGGTSSATTSKASTTTTKLVAGNTTIETADLVMIGVFHPREFIESQQQQQQKEGGQSQQQQKQQQTFVGSLFSEGSSIQKIDEGMNHGLQELYLEQDMKVMSTVGSVTPVLRTIHPLSSSTKSAISTSSSTKHGSSRNTTKRYAIMSLGPSWSAATPSDGSARAPTITTPLTVPSIILSEPPSGIGFTIGTAIAALCRSEKKISVANIHLPDVIVNNPMVLRDIATSFYTELYRDIRYKGTATKAKLQQEMNETSVLTTVYIRCEDSVVSQDVLDNGYIIGQGVILAKDIVNAPHNVLNSVSLAAVAQQIAASSIDQRITCQILNKEECEALHMGAYLGVARGSETPPQFIHLSFIPPPSKDIAAPRKRIGLVGKGLLFDTGGYNIKTQMMELMKFDCGGAAAVLGAAHVIGQLTKTMAASTLPKNVEVHFIVAACENMINDRAMVASDILSASNGKTIEVLNTDAEGRLTLADALVYADVTCQCDTIVELSTLTGACMMSLGKELCGVWTHNDALALEIANISSRTLDKSWRMPMVTEYEEQIQSKIADLQNMGGKYGGAITAALFLQHFVTADKPFAHLDIAGPVWDDATGATGFGTKLLVEFISQQWKGQ